MRPYPSSLFIQLSNMYCTPTKATAPAAQKSLTTPSRCGIIIWHPQKGAHIAGWSSPVARRAHNPKVGGSNPPPATILTCQKRYLAKKSRKHAVYGIFLYPKLGVSLKDIFRLFQALVRSWTNDYPFWALFRRIWIAFSAFWPAQIVNKLWIFQKNHEKPVLSP